MFDIYLFTLPNFVANEADTINKLFSAGLKILHLRKPQASSEELEKLIRGVDEVYYDRLVIHDHFQLAKMYAIGGIHLNRRNPLVPNGFEGRVSKSCHSLREVVEAKKQCQYVSLSPIYDSVSKQGYSSAFEESQLTEASHLGIIDNKVFALGGVLPSHISELKNYGFGGAMVLGYVWQSENPLSAYLELQEVAAKG